MRDKGEVYLRLKKKGGHRELEIISRDEYGESVVVVNIANLQELLEIGYKINKANCEDILKERNPLDLHVREL